MKTYLAVAFLVLASILNVNGKVVNQLPAPGTPIWVQVGEGDLYQVIIRR